MRSLIDRHNVVLTGFNVQTLSSIPNCFDHSLNELSLHKLYEGNQKRPAVKQRGK